MKTTIILLACFFLSVLSLAAFGQKRPRKLVPVSVDNKWGYSDDEGHIIIPAQFVEASEFSEGLASVRVEEMYTETWGYIDETGRMVINTQDKLEVIQFAPGRNSPLKDYPEL